MKKTISIIIIIGFIISLTFCTNVTKNKPLNEIPSFKISPDSIQRTFNSMISAEHVNVCGHEKISVSSKKIVLEIDILNGNNIPSDNNDRKALSKKIASFIKYALQNQNAYDEYLIKYMKKSKGSSISSSEAYEFRNEQL